MAPTITVYKSYWGAATNNEQDWEAPEVMSVVRGGSNNWYYALYDLNTARGMPAGYTYYWRFYAWDKHNTTDSNIGQDSETMVFRDGTTFTARANTTYTPYSTPVVYGWGNESWYWWFDIVSKNPISYTATYVYYNGTDNTNISYNFNSYFTAPTPAQTGYTFSKWTSNPNIGEGINFTWTHAGNITFYAQWTIIIRTATFSSTTNGITISRYVQVNYGSSVNFPTFKAVGYTFLRWVDASNTTYAYISSLSDDITLYAVWKEKDNINFSELERVYNGTRGIDPLPGVKSISIGKFRAESGQIGTNQIKLITHFKGKG